jgi:nucleotide-binding universal stress UspA family protein
MFQRILLPVDLTDRHDKALRMAGDLGRQSNGEVILLHVIEAIPGLSRQEDADFYSRLNTAARAHLRRLAAPLLEAGIACRTEVLTGQRAVDTARFAAEAKSDVIVLTSPPFQPQHPLPALGSMAWKISLLAACPILLVKN